MDKESKNASRTRIAPSPTGELHIGHLRTALFNWAYARKTTGQFIIRVEDTDRERLVEGAQERTLDVIADYGLDWDEGPRVGGKHGPYIQSGRLDIYKDHIQQLLDKNAAYYCFCTEERLQKMREQQKKKGIIATKYDRHCLKLTPGEIEKNLKEGTPYVVRLKIPDDQEIEFTDHVLGKITVNSDNIDDQILIKSDGFPTYHFAVVVDDHMMGITHVLRGNDWIPSTPKHVLIHKAFGWDLPVYAHLPNLKEMGAGKKLSKRFGAVAAKEFLSQGYLPEAVLNFLMFLGWNPGTEKEIYSLEEFIRDFSLEKIQHADLVSFDRQKLLWMNAQYIRNLSDEQLVQKLTLFLKEKRDSDLLLRTAPLVKDRIKTLAEFNELAGFFFERPHLDSSLLGKNSPQHLTKALDILQSMDDWNIEQINTSLMSLIEKEGFKTGDFFMDLRIAITGKKQTPPINESIVILGKQETLERLNLAISNI